MLSPEAPLVWKLWFISTDFLVGVPTKPPKPQLEPVNWSELTPRQKGWFVFVNLLSGSRILTPIFLLAFYLPAIDANNIGHAVFWIVIVAFLTATDLVDGTIARKKKVPSQLGNILDHTTDLLTLLAILYCWYRLFAHADFTGWTDLVYRFTIGIIAVTGFCLIWVALLNIRKAKNVHEGANNAGRRKYLIQGIGLLPLAVGVTWFYHDITWLAGFTIAADFIFCVAFVPTWVSIEGYQERNRAGI